MKKPVLVLLIIADLGVMSGAAFILNDRLHHGRPGGKPDAGLPALPDMPPAAAQAPAAGAPAAAPAAPAPAPRAELKRRILFNVKTSKASRIQITGDFTDWKPKDLKRGAGNVWSTVVEVTPGVYSYNYILDGKRKIKDPNNSRATPDGKSILTVKGPS